MAQIREYTAQTDALRPTETGVEAFAQAGRRAGAFYTQAAESERAAAQARARAAGALSTAERERFGTYAGIAGATGAAIDQAEQFASHQEISHGTATLADAAAGLTQAWNNTIKDPNFDPNDPSVQSKFMQGTFAPWAETFLKGFDTPGGKDWAQTQIAHLRMHLTEKTAADGSTIAGMAIQKNVNDFERSATNAVRNDPSSVPFFLSLAERSLEGQIATNPNLRATDAERIRTEVLDKIQSNIVRGGALGAIENSSDPETAWQSWAQRYPQFIDAREMDQFAKAARAYRRASEIDEDRAERKQKERLNEASETRRDDYIKDIFSEDSKATLKGVLGDPLLRPKDREHLIGVLQREDKPEAIAAVSHRNSMQILSDIRTGKITDNGPIYDAYIRGDLNKADLGFLNTEFNNLRTPEGQRLGVQKQEFLKGVEPSLDKSLFGVPDPDGKEKFYRFSFELDRRMQEYRRLGKDPYDLLDPNKPDYMGLPKVLEQFQGPMRQQINEAVRKTGGVNAPAPTSIPASLRGIAALEYSATRQQYRDQTTGAIYDKNGALVRSGSEPSVPVR